MRVGVVSFWFRIFIFVLADGIRDRLAHVPSLRTREGDDRGHLRVDFGFGCFSFAIQSRKFGMKFPKTFLNHLIFLTADGSARIGAGPSGFMKELLTFNKWERLLSVHNASLAISRT